MNNEVMTVGDLIYIIKMQVARMHVSASNKVILKMVFDMLGKRRHLIPRDLRKLIYKSALENHENNLKVYVRVMSGNFNG